MFNQNRPHIYQTHGYGYGSQLYPQGVNRDGYYDQQNRYMPSQQYQQPRMHERGGYYQPTGINEGFMMNNYSNLRDRSRESYSSSDNGSPSRRN